MSLVTGLFFPGTSLETAVIPTAQASSFTLQYFPYYVWCSNILLLLLLLYYYIILLYYIKYIIIIIIIILGVHNNVDAYLLYRTASLSLKLITLHVT